MSDSPRSSPRTDARRPDRSDLTERLRGLGRTLGERESEHRDQLARARACAERIHARVDRALVAFHMAAAEAGAPHLRVSLGAVHTDDKHLRSLEFDLVRGRHKAIVTAKSRGEITLVGPFRMGKTEGPCLSFPFDAGSELDEALASFLERFLEEAATP